MPANTPRGYTYPLYTDPANFPAQLQDFAQDVDLDVAAQVAATATALNTPSCRVSSAVATNITPNTTTTVTWTIEEYDNANLANLGVNNDRITFAVPGIYLIHAEMNARTNFNATVSGRAMFMEFSLGASFNVANVLRSSSFRDSQLSITHMYRATNPADFVRIRFRHDSPANVSFDDRSLSVTKVGV